MNARLKQLLVPGVILGSLCLTLAAEPIPVTLKEVDGYHLLYRDGEPYFIRGAGGGHDLELLARTGGNSVRTWGDPGIELLDRAHELGLSVCVGLWIEHERHGFDYSDDDAVAEQIRRHCATIDRLKDHPAVLLWGIGNEVEIDYTNKRVWDVVEAVAAYAKQVDPNHPTMTVIAHAPKYVIKEILEKCPSIDILGTNSYGGVGVVAGALRTAGWEKGYIVTEWGADGGWEVDRTDWGAEIEPSSTEKAHQRAYRYGVMTGDRAHCLGSYAFHWGYKQETTPTWFNIFLEDGTATESLEILQYLWTGRFPEQLAPRISELLLNRHEPQASVTVKPGDQVLASFELTRGDPEQVRIEWELMPESTDKRKGGDEEERPEPVEIAKVSESTSRLEFSAPGEPGPYRLFLYVYGGNGTVATANFPFLVK
jgi:hypothetical protein